MKLSSEWLSAPSAISLICQPPQVGMHFPRRRHNHWSASPLARTPPPSRVNVSNVQYSPTLAEYGLGTSSAGQLCLLHHGRILFLEPLPQAFRSSQIFVHTSHDTAFLSGYQGFRGEVVDTIVKTPLHEFRVHLNKGVLVMNGSGVVFQGEGVHAVINSFICFLSIRAFSSLCSAAVSLPKIVSR